MKILIIGVGVLGSNLAHSLKNKYKNGGRKNVKYIRLH